MSHIKRNSDVFSSKGSFSLAFPEVDPPGSDHSHHLPWCMECGESVAEYSFFRCVNSLCISKNPQRATHIDCANAVWRENNQAFRAPAQYECPDCRGPD